MTFSKLVLVGVSALAACLCAPAQAFITEAPRATVVEYYNPALNHYFLTIDQDEIAGLDAGKAGPWIRTGNAFEAYALTTVGFCPARGCGDVVSRFYGTPGLGPNSHFYTLVPGEVDALKQPGTGWTLEKQAFKMYAYGKTYPPESAHAGCPGGTIPVYRLYNNRWMFNDSNHRYVTKQALRDKMVSLGWIDEGAQLCSPGEATTALATYVLDGAFNVRAGDRCGTVGPCVLVKGVPVPDMYLPWEQMTNGQRSRYTARACCGNPPLYAVAGSTVDTGFGLSFLLGDMRYFTAYLDTFGRSGAFSNIDAAYQLPTTATPSDARLFPWRADQEMETEFALDVWIFVTTVELRSPGSAAYGHPSVEFRDSRSGHSFHFNVVAYGTVPAGNDFAGADARDGKPIVATSFRASTPFLRSVANDTLSTPPGYYPPEYYNPAHKTARLEYRVNREEFARVLAAARTVDGALSADPADYFVDNFRFTNEVFGDGAIGMSFQWLVISRVPRS